MSVIIKIIEKNYPDCLPIKVVNKDIYENIVWLKKGNYTKPTKAQVEGFIKEEQSIIDSQILSNNKKQKYKTISDSLFIEWQYEKEIAVLSQSKIDELKTAWIDEVKKIKSE